MGTIAQSIRIDEEIVSLFDQLAEATGRSRNQLYVDALRRYAQVEGWQITEVRQTLAAVEDGQMVIRRGRDVVGDLLKDGLLTAPALADAEERYGIPQDRRY